MNRETRAFIAGLIQVGFFSWATLLTVDQIKDGNYDWFDGVLFLVQIWLLYNGLDRIRTVI